MQQPCRRKGRTKKKETGRPTHTHTHTIIVEEKLAYFEHDHAGSRRVNRICNVDSNQGVVFPLGERPDISQLHYHA